MKNIIVVCVIIASVIMIQSCQKKDSSDLNSSSNLATNLNGAIFEVTSSDVATFSSADVQSVSVEKFDSTSSAIHIGSILGSSKSLGFGKYNIPHIDDCATVTVSSATFPKEITIDYGTGCTDKRGHTKQGKIIITISDTAIAEGAVRTIVYQDFYIDSIKVDYTATLKNTGKNEQGNWVIEGKAVQTITKDGDVSIQSSDDVAEWVSGFETTDKSDDVYYKSGIGSITVNDSIVFTKKITKPLLYDRTCEYILSGMVELTRGANIVIIDYGDGECDSVATVTTNGTTEEINLHSHKYKEGGKFDKNCPDGFGHKKHRGK